MPNDRDEWLAARRQGIGASEAAAVCGLNPWATALDVYAAKMGLGDQPDNDAMRLGRKLEPVVASEYQDRTGTEIVPPEPALMRHPEHDWMIASLDRITLAKPQRVVELKTTRIADETWGEQGTDEVPEHYLIQVQHQLAVSSLDLADLAVLIGGRDLRIYTIRRNDALIEALVERESEFWLEHVLRRVPPAPDWSHSATAQTISRLARLGTDIVDAPDDIAELWREYKTLASEMSVMDRRRDEHRARILAAIHEHAGLRLPNGIVVAGKLVSVKEHVRKASSYIKLSEVKP